MSKMVDKDKNIWWDIVLYDIADCIPDMKKGVYTFLICVGADLQNIGKFTIGHTNNLDTLDKRGEIYRLLNKNLSSIVDELSLEIYLKIHSDIDPDKFSVWFDKILSERGYKSKLFNNVKTVVKKNNYQYERTVTAKSYCKYLWCRLKELI